MALMARCPRCGEDNIEAGAKVYVSQVVVDTATHQITSYKVDFVEPGIDPVHDAFIGDGAGFSELHIYCDCGWNYDNDGVRGEPYAPKDDTTTSEVPA